MSGRFLELPTHDGEPRYTVPIETGVRKKLDEASLAEWFKGHGDFADGYATRIIPLDILYLFSLGAFLAIASAMLADAVRWPIALSGFPSWVWWLLPVVYIICDFAEDTLIVTMLRWRPTIQEQALDALTYLRAIKSGLSLFRWLRCCFSVLRRTFRHLALVPRPGVS